jgi:hypothetical protein
MEGHRRGQLDSFRAFIFSPPAPAQPGFSLFVILREGGGSTLTPAPADRWIPRSSRGMTMGRELGTPSVVKKQKNSKKN